MKKIIHILCSLFFATTISFPVDALANPIEEFNDSIDEQMAEIAESDNYFMTLVSGDFDLQFFGAGQNKHQTKPILFVTDPNGKTITNAQVVTTLIDSNGRQMMSRAFPALGGTCYRLTCWNQGGTGWKLKSSQTDGC